MAHQSTRSVNHCIVVEQKLITRANLGLGCDTVQSYTLVLPNGTVSEVDSSQPDLFFALKGGLNRFGIVTEIRFKLFQHPKQVWVSLPFCVQAFSCLITFHPNPQLSPLLCLMVSREATKSLRQDPRLMPS